VRADHVDHVGGADHLNALAGTDGLSAVGGDDVARPDGEPLIGVPILDRGNDAGVGLLPVENLVVVADVAGRA
jgi:hypothetical protein